MALAYPLAPPKTPTTFIPQFPDNPKTLILEQCKTTRDLHQVHGHLIKTLHLRNPDIASNFLESAAILLGRPMDYAVSIFRHLDEPDSAAYNIMIRGFTLNRSPAKSIDLFVQMAERSVEPDEFTYICVLKACSKLKALQEGEQIHARFVKSGVRSNGFIENTLLHMYSNCGEIEIARKVFDKMPDRDAHTWNSMISGYAKAGNWEEIVKLFRRMIEIGVRFTPITLMSVLPACGRLKNLELGKQIHEFIETNQLKDDPALLTALIDMYSKCNHLDIARKLFDEMPHRDVVAWTSMISGYSQANRCKEALSLFHDMQKANIKPNEVTMVSLLSSCAMLGALETGKWAHSYITKNKLKLTVSLATALMDFYAKCGCINEAIEVFQTMPWKNVQSWNVLIRALASNGEAKRAIESFELMLMEKNLEPNEITFLIVLTACTHGGLVDEGRKWFSRMTSDFGIKPRINHYGCMVDILSRAGLIEEAYLFIQNMPVRPNAIIWRTLLASCRIHKNVEIAEEAFKNIERLEPAHSGDYILLSNVYSSAGKFKDAMNTRSWMKETGVKKPPGFSFIEVEGVVHEFLAEDDEHPYLKEIYESVEVMMGKIRSAGYVADMSEGRVDAEEREGKMVSVSHHSEKLAIAFGLMKTPPGTTIRVSKNLRICKDCHSAAKMVSKVYGREIVVRDRNRFHHFKDGTCSCKDYW